jgi:RHS repeat-associated protein
MATQVVSTTTTTYLINDLGLRVKKSNTGNTNYYAYDEQGHVLGEYDSTGAALKETAYIGDLPVGVLSKSGATYTLYSMLPDWLGAPHIITNSSGTKAWTWDHLAWGDNAPNQNPGGLGTFVYDWRLPGQVYDSESSLNYNAARDYNPSLSRYVESDPLGLNGGQFSTYSYAAGNPLSNADPTGRDRAPFLPGNPSDKGPIVVPYPPSGNGPYLSPSDQCFVNCVFNELVPVTKTHLTTDIVTDVLEAYGFKVMAEACPAALLGVTVLELFNATLTCSLECADLSKKP